MYIMFIELYSGNAALGPDSWTTCSEGLLGLFEGKFYIISQNTSNMWILEPGHRFWRLKCVCTATQLRITCTINGPSSHILLHSGARFLSYIIARGTFWSITWCYLILILTVCCNPTNRGTISHLGIGNQYWFYRRWLKIPSHQFRALLGENFSKVKCNITYVILPASWTLPTAITSGNPMRSFRLSVLGRTIALLGGELACNAVIWAISGFLFHKPESRGVLSLCLLAWVRPYW